MRNSQADVLATTSILLTVTLACAWLPLLHLTAASLWSDELATVYLSAPDLSLKAAYISRMLPDINPPIYYLLQHFWLGMFSDFTFGSRLLSALFGMAAVTILFVFGGERLTWPARAFLSAAPVTGYTYIYFATEARAYGLSILIGVVQVILFRRILDRIQSGRPPQPTALVSLGALSLLNGLTHHYGLLYSCALFGVLCVYALGSGSYPALRRIISIGAAFTGANVTYTLLAMRAGDYEADAAWFSGEMGYLFRNIREFVWLGFGGHHGAALLIAVLAGLTVAAALTRAGWSGLIADAAAPHVLAVTIVVALSVLVSLLVQPSTLFRYLLICIPSIWLGAAEVIDVFIRQSRPPVRRLVMGAMAAATLWGVPFAILSGGKNREDWRESARFVGSIEACHGSRIPVYADPGLASVPLFSLYLDRANQQRPTHITEYKPGGPCPITLWAVHSVYDPIVQSALEGGGEIVRFEHVRAWDCWPTTCRLVDRPKDLGAVVILREGENERTFDGRARQPQPEELP